MSERERERDRDRDRERERERESERERQGETERKSVKNTFSFCADGKKLVRESVTEEKHILLSK